MNEQQNSAEPQYSGYKDILGKFFTGTLNEALQIAQYYMDRNLPVPAEIEEVIRGSGDQINKLGATMSPQVEAAVNKKVWDAIRRTLQNPSSDSSKENK